MGSPTIYYYGSGARLTKVTLPRLSRLEPVYQPQLQTLTTGALAMVQVAHGVRRQWRLTMDRVSLLSTAGKATYNELRAVVSHLQMGNAIGLSTDHDKTYAGYLAGTVNPGQVYVVWSGNAFRAWNSSAAPAAGDHVVVETAPMYGLEEAHKVNTYVGSQIAFTDNVLFPHSGLSSLVRWEGFLPALRMPGDVAGAPPLTNEHGITFSLDLTLEMDAAVYLDPDTTQGLADFGLGNTSAGILQTDGSLEARLAKFGSAGNAAGEAGSVGLSYAARQRSLGRL